MANYFQPFVFGKNIPKIDWFPDVSHLLFNTIEVVGYDIRKVGSIISKNKKGQSINTARSVGTDKVNAQGIKESFLTKGICVSELPPVILDSGESADGFTRNIVLLDLGQESYVYLVVKLKEGFTIEDAKDELGLGLNDHLQQKPAKIEDFKKRLAKWIHRQEEFPSREKCLTWFNSINHSFTLKRVENAVDSVLIQIKSKETMESYDKKQAQKRGGELLGTKNIVAFDNKSGASLPRAFMDVLDNYQQNNGKKPVCVGFLNSVEAENAEAARKKLISRVGYYNSIMSGILRDYQEASKNKEEYKFFELVGFIPQIVDVEDDIVNY